MTVFKNTLTGGIVMVFEDSDGLTFLNIPQRTNGYTVASLNPTDS